MSWHGYGRDGAGACPHPFAGPGMGPHVWVLRAGGVPRRCPQSLRFIGRLLGVICGKRTMDPRLHVPAHRECLRSRLQDHPALGVPCSSHGSTIESRRAKAAPASALGWACSDGEGAETKSEAAPFHVKPERVRSVRCPGFTRGYSEEPRGFWKVSPWRLPPRFGRVGVPESTEAG